MRTAGLPVRIRGVTYPSHRIAARALGVSERTLRLALDAGRVDQVGLRRKKGGAPGVPCVYRGQEYPSQIAAALACNVSTNSVYRAVRRAKGGRISLPRQPDRLKLNGPGSVTSAHPGPDHGDLSEEIAQMADTSQYTDSTRLINRALSENIGGSA